MKIKHLIFDFDGTLADSQAIFVTVFNRLAEKHNYRPIDLETMDHLRSLSIIDRCRYLNVPLYKVPLLAAEFLSYYKQETAHISLYDGIKEMLESLQANGYKFSIISSNDVPVIESFLSENGIGIFDGIYPSRNIFGKDKVIKSFLRKKGIHPSEAIYIGDELRDIQACQKAGIKIIWVSWGYDPESLIIDENPDFMANNPKEILTLLEQINIK